MKKRLEKLNAFGHGVFVGGMESDVNGLGCIVGSWSPTGTAGEYYYIVYPYGSEGSPPEGTATVSGNTLTLVVDMSGPVTLTFTRE